MHDIDLIPQEYHRKQLFTVWLKAAVITLFLISSLLVTAYIMLRIESQDIQQKSKLLQSKKAITSSQQLQLKKLNQQKSGLDQQLKLLAGLRSGAAAEKMFSTIVTALPVENLWITDWKFRRAGTPVENVDRAVNTGYFIVIPQGAGNSKNKQETWKIETQMTLQGKSMDHSALSEFVLNLTQKPEIENVRVVNTRLEKINKIKLVNFNLEIIVSTIKSKD